MCIVNEGMRNMTGDQNAFGTQISPIVRQVRKIDTPLLHFLLDVGLKTETIHPTRFAREKALVKCSVMFIGNPTVDGQKWRKERRYAVELEPPRQICHHFRPTPGQEKSV